MARADTRFDTAITDHCAEQESNRECEESPAASPDVMFELLEYMISGVLRLLAGPLDRRRIVRFFRQRGSRSRMIRWSPFSTGWFSNWHDRYYKVEYEDASGVTCTVTCRISWRTGVVLCDEEDEAVANDGSR